MSEVLQEEGNMAGVRLAKSALRNEIKNRLAQLSQDEKLRQSQIVVSKVS